MSSSYQALIEPFFKTKEGKKYIQEILSGKRGVLVNLDDIDPQISGIIINDAVKHGIRAFEDALKGVVGVANPSINPQSIEIGFYGECIPVIKIQNLSSKDVGKIVKVRGLVNRTSPIRPFYTQVVFKCRNCGELTSLIFQENPFVITKPFNKCDGCGDKRPQFDAIFEHSMFVDSQEFSMQESHEGTSIPKRLPLISFKGYLMNFVNCGDLLEVTGVVKLTSVHRRNRVTRFNNPYIEVYHIFKKSKDPDTLEISPEDEKLILEIAKKEDTFDFLTANLAPSLYGMKLPKWACLLALFGGVKKEKGDINVRGNINILLVGDPSTGKSQLLRTVAELAPNAMYCTGKGTTAAGLTAAMNKDTQTGEWVIDAGVFVLADKGIACIDEIDKMDTRDRVNIHEAMEQQTVSISKAGVHATLNARTAVIAAANPITGRYDTSRSVQENIAGNFPPTLLNRFDLIFVLIDEPNEKYDKLVLKHIANGEKTVTTLDRELFRKYIAFAKRINPIVPPLMAEKLTTYFLEVRKGITVSGKKERIAIAYRQAEALFRIAEAHARASLKEEVDEDDIAFTVNIFTEFLVGIEYDVTGVATATPRTKAKAINDLFNILGKMPSTCEFTRNDLKEEAMECGINDERFNAGWKILKDKGMIMLRGRKLNNEEYYTKV